MRPPPQLLNDLIQDLEYALRGLRKSPGFAAATMFVAFALAGALLGGIASLSASQWMQPLLFREPAKDPLIYGLVALVMPIVALIASASPAARTAKADPNRALRAE
jgi:hypothetical protein